MANRLVTLGRGVAVAALGLLIAGCPRQADEPAPPAQPIELPTPPTLPPTGPTALTRLDMLDAARLAGSDYASGAAVEGADPLVGRTFAILMPVGCSGPAVGLPEDSADGVARVAWADQQRAIQFSLTPGDWTDSALIAGARGGWELVEGIWLSRPWLASDGCPAVQADPLRSGQLPATINTVGLAVVHSREDSRLGRRNGRAYTYALRGEGDAAPRLPEGGWRLRLEGRVVGFPDGGAFRCRAPGPDIQPVCIAAVQLDRVALETTSGEVQSEWRDG